MKAIKVEVKRKTILSEAKKSCAHHWLFETGGGRVVVGVCKLCGDKREFRNSCYGIT